jgi:transposase InsO family protein
MKLLAGKEYHRKTTSPHQLWATDASYFRVVGWGYYYLVMVTNDYSRFILTWKLRRDSILARRKEVQSQTLRRRQLQNHQIRQLHKSSSPTSSLH